MPGISIDTPPEPQQPISLDDSQSSTLPISGNVAAVRATKAQFGLPELNIAYDDYYNLIQSGNEKAVRTDAAARLDLKHATERTDLIANFARNTDSPVSLQGLDAITNTVGTNRPVDPKSVFEDNYSRRYIETLYKVAKNQPGSWLDDAMREVPKHVEKAVEDGVSFMAKQQYLTKKYEDAHEAYSNLATQDKVVRKLQMAMPFYFQAMMRGNVDPEVYISGGDIAKTGGLLGNVLEQQRLQLIGLPYPEFKKKVDEIYENLIENNPEAAISFMAAMLGQSHAERVGANALSALEVTAIPSLARLGSAVVKSLIPKFDLINQTRGAVREMITSSHTSDFPKGNVNLKDIIDLDASQWSYVDKGQSTALTVVPRVRPVPQPETVGGVPFKPPPGVEPPSDQITRAFVDDQTREVGTQYPPTDMERAFLDDGSREVYQDPFRGYDPSTAVATTNRNQVELFNSARDIVIAPEPGALAAAGDLGGAAVSRFVSRVATGFQGDVGTATREAVQALSSIHKDNMLNRKMNPGQAGQEIVNRLNEVTEGSVRDVMTAVQNVTNVTRLNGIKAAETVVQALKDTTTNRPGLRNRVMNADLIHHEFTNEYYVHAMLGKNNGELFRSFTEAQAVARWEGIINPNIRGKGLGFYIDVRAPVDERMQVVRDFIVSTANSKRPPESILTSVNHWRSPESTLSYDQRVNRKVMVYNPPKLIEALQKNFQDIISEANVRFRGQDIYQVVKNRGKWADWDRAVRAEADTIDWATGKRGNFFKNPADLEDWYRRNIGRPPDVVETRAYFAFTDTVEHLKGFQQMEAHKMASRVGTQQYQFIQLGPDGSQVKTPFINAIKLDHLPGGKWTIAILGDRVGDEKVVSGNHISFASERKILEREVEQGLKDAWEIYDTEARPLENYSPAFKNTKIRYVVANASNMKPLEYNVLPRNEGGIIEYDYDWAIKKARIFKENVGSLPPTFHYEGDIPVTNLEHRAMGTEAIKRMAEVEKFIMAGDEAGALAAYRTEPSLPFPYETFRGWFNSSKDLYGNIVPPKLVLGDPYYVVGKNEMIVNIDDSLAKRYTNKDTGTEFIDGTVSGSMARQSQVQFTGQRDVYEQFTMKDVGTRYKPLYDYEPTPVLDLVSHLNRATNQVVNSLWASDYNAASIEHWVMDAGPWLKADPAMRQYSPNHVFAISGTREAFKSNAPEDVVSNLLQARFKIKQLQGTPSKIQNTFDGWAQRTADMLYEKQGPGFDTDIVPFTERKGLSSKTLLIPAHLLSSATDISSYVRSMTYHTTMGLFTPTQLIQQSMTFGNIFAIHPRYAAAGTYATTLHHWSMINPGMVDGLDTYASGLNKTAAVKYIDEKMGAMTWKPGQWKEARDALVNRTGFLLVGNTHSYSAEEGPPPLIISAGRQIADMGTVFFRAAELNVRAAAWYTAAYRFRDQHPVETHGRLTQEDINQILEHANMLAGNMDRSSKSNLEFGVFSPPTQFLGYPIRQAEMLADNRLTQTHGKDSWKARARVIAANFLLFGLPITMGITALPLGEPFRQAALNFGYVVGEKWWSSFIMEGGLAATAAFVTGGGDSQKGNWYNIGPKSGSPGITLPTDLLAGDKPMWELYGGAQGTFLSNIIKYTGGLRSVMMSALERDGKYPLTVDDLLEPVKISATGRSVVRLEQVLRTGKWAANNEQITAEDVSKINAAWMTVTGYQPTKVYDTKYTFKTGKEVTEDYAAAEKEFQKQMRRGVLAAEDGNPQQRDIYIARAIAQLVKVGMPDTMWHKVFQRADDLNKEILTRIDLQAGLGDKVPEYRKAIAQEIYKKKLLIEQKQRGNK